MKKKHLVIALSLIVCAAAAEFIIVMNNHNQAKSDKISVALKPAAFQDNISSIDNAIVVEGTNSSALSREYSGVCASETNYAKAAEALLKNLDNIEKISGYSIKCNTDIKKEVNGKTYIKVVDRNFGSTDDVRSYLDSYLTNSLIAERYSGITAGDEACLKDIDGGLYVMNVIDKGTGFRWETDENGHIVMNISDSSNGGFTIETTGHSLKVVNDSSMWKINSID